jgi:hypothetical protein
MSGVFSRTRIRAAVGLIAAYAIALQTLFAAFAPLPANAQGVDFGQVICFGNANAGTPAGDDNGAPLPASGKYHCVLCVSAAAAAILPEPVCALLPLSGQPSQFSVAKSDTPVSPLPARSGLSRAPPLTL